MIHQVVAARVDVVLSSRNQVPRRRKGGGGEGGGGKSKKIMRGTGMGKKMALKLLEADVEDERGEGKEDGGGDKGVQERFVEDKGRGFGKRILKENKQI